MINLNLTDTCPLCNSDKITTYTYPEDTSYKYPDGHHMDLCEVQCKDCNCKLLSGNKEIFSISIHINSVGYIVSFIDNKIQSYYADNDDNDYTIYSYISESIPDFNSHQELVDNINILTLFK